MSRGLRFNWVRCTRWIGGSLCSNFELRKLREKWGLAIYGSYGWIFGLSFDGGWWISACRGVRGLGVSIWDDLGLVWLVFELLPGVIHLELPFCDLGMEPKLCACVWVIHVKVKVNMAYLQSFELELSGSNSIVESWGLLKRVPLPWNAWNFICLEWLHGFVDSVLLRKWR